MWPTRSRWRSRSWRGEINQQIARIRETYGELSAMEYTAHSKDGMVSVTVGLHGRVRGIHLKPQVYRSLSPLAVDRGDNAADRTGDCGGHRAEQAPPDTPHASRGQGSASGGSASIPGPRPLRSRLMRLLHPWVEWPSRSAPVRR
ncbi:YbaB/EbfC family nucleoid-associated protein [Nonomuraea sp. KM90]|uniref:YbaB/EbfC family nucleoid-associated protein n=1 Tax=Nonomuraea sp. KM90 TaxID=3457428 RepID=UPI003FCC3501